jgi:hypothetical protein
MYILQTIRPSVLECIDNMSKNGFEKLNIIEKILFTLVDQLDPELSSRDMFLLDLVLTSCSSKEINKNQTLVWIKIFLEKMSDDILST